MEGQPQKNSAEEQQIEHISISARNEMHETSNSEGSTDTSSYQASQSGNDPFKNVRENEAKEGYLEKRGGGLSTFGRKSWKRRLMVLETGVLRYLKDAGQKVPQGTITLHNTDRVEEYEEFPQDPKHAFMFKLFTVKRNLLMSAQTAEERTEWISALTRAILKSEPYMLSDRLSVQ
eukprot:TRINITY_DN10389_c0_g1_i2.p1 TRINITY_DN10389_c0_g1~~TRINITY_DN10389_c0_g1_i2.p1  ORF type:complete len:191 (-),score=13.26 TRINITY_DN10389_c0_g1_i2:55-582(-)